MFRSATFKLTMWYLAIAMAISLLFSVALYNVTTGELERGLSSESQNLVNNFPVFRGETRYGLAPQPYYENSSHRILLRLIVFNVIVLIFAGGASYWLAKRTLEPIEAAHKQQKRFTADVSHELRTPLTAIKMESEVALLNQKSAAKELRQTIKSNLEEVTKLEVLINNLLKLTRLEADELQQNFQPVESKAVFEGATEAVSKQAGRRRIKLNVYAKSALVHGDKDSLIQLVSVILDNAIKYSPAGSTVELRAKSLKDQIVWQVSDNGPGIKPEALEHIFDRFYRADSSRGPQTVEGFGLGLSIAKMIADLHRASITINSQVGHGTTAIISLPKG